MFKNAPIAQTMQSPETLESGYEEFKSILSDWMLVQFFVPCHVWSELQESKEWKEFESLLERYQKEHIQKEH